MLWRRLPQKACWLFLPRICRVAILPRSRRMGSVNRQVCSSSPWKFPGMSVVQPIPMVHKSMVCSSTPPISFVLAPLWLFRYVRCPILLGSEPEKYQVPCFREATSINCNSVDLFSPLDFSYYLLPYLFAPATTFLQLHRYCIIEKKHFEQQEKFQKWSQITTSWQGLKKYTVGK